MINKMNRKSWFEVIRYVLLFLYFLSISAFQLETDFDKVFFRVVFALIIIFNLIKKKKILITGALKWNFLFWVFFFLSSLWASDMNDTFWTMGVAVQMIGIFFFLPMYIKDETSLIKVLKILLLALVCSIAVLMFRTPIADFGTERLGSAIGLNSNAFGLRMAIGAIISLYLFHNNDGKGTKILYVTALALFVAFALFSGSKKALLAIIIGVPVCEIFLATGMRKIFKILGIIVLFAGITMLMFNNQQLYDVVGSRIEKTFYTLTEQNSRKTTDFSLMERQFYIDKGMELFNEHPLIGYGGNNFITYMREINYSHVAYSHNNYVELLSCLGLIGLLIYYIFWIIVTYRLVNIYRLERKRGSRDSISMLFLVIMAVLLVLDYGMVSYISDFNMIMLCLLYMTYRLKKQELSNLNCLNVKEAK